MIEEKDIRKVIHRVCIETLGYADLREDEDYFDRGASSLTIVELQLQIETELGLKVPTSDLMRDPSIAGWSRIYRTAQTEMPGAPLPAVQS